MKFESKLLALLLISLLASVAATSTTHAQTVLVPTGSVWKFLDDGSDQDTLWREPGFNDSVWDSGYAELGYGDGDEATTVSFGPSPTNKYITTYFRHSFTVSDPSQHPYLQLRLLRDDGAVVYLNGAEINRTNLPDGDIYYSTRAQTAIGSTDEDVFHESIASGGHLTAGTNVLAVEIHQVSPTSSDISLELELLGIAAVANPIRKAPYLIYPGDNEEMQVLWQLTVPDTSQIQWGLDTGYTLGSTNTLEYGSDHQHSYTIDSLTPSTEYFYRVIAEGDTCTGSFWTAPPTYSTKARFFAYGDTRTYPADHDKVAAAIMSAYAAKPSPNSLLISVGDYINAGDLEADWDNQFFDPSYLNIQSMFANLPHQATMGNHEQSGVLFAKYFPYPFVTDRYWSYDYGPAHFTVVDQYVPYGSGSAQLAWIEADLASTTKRWKFLYLHEPGWSAGGGHGNDVTVQNDIQPLCEQYGVSIVFGGHNHYYARAVVNEIQHITTGGGGAPLRTPETGYPNIVETASALHYCDIEIDGGNLWFAAVSAAGDTLDQFTLQGDVTSVEPFTAGRSQHVLLHAARPNPLTSSTTLAFTLPTPAQVELGVYDVNGKRIRTFVNARLDAGRFEYPWDGRDDSGRALPSGLYFYRLRADRETLSGKVILLP